jgi:hypothetical protein
MKTIKMFVAALCCVCAAIGLNSCGENVHMQAAYGIGIHSMSASGDDFFNFCNYLREKQVPFDGDDAIKIFEGKSQKDCDAKAIAFFNEQAAKLSYEEVAAFVQYPDKFYIEYSIVASKKDPNEETRVLGAWIYPKPVD